MKKKNIIANIFLIIMIVLFLNSCEGREEVLRLLSPDNQVEAVLIETNRGATTPLRYLLYLVSPGSSPSKHDLVLEAIHIEGFEIKWRESKFLEIRYKNARIYHFQSIWSSSSNYKYKVELRLIPLKEGSTID
jgi:hypothetical protein